MNDRPMLKLIGTDGNRLYRFDLAPGKYVLGRSQEQDFHVPDKTVSRAHATIEVSASGDEVFVTDTDSYNGTTVNNMRISGRVRVAIGDRIEFGRTEFKIARETDKTAAPTPPPTMFSSQDPERSVFLPINEALKPLPQKVTDLPELFPTLSEMARILVLSEPKEAMLERSLGLVNKVIPAERLAVLLRDDSGESVYAAATLLPTGKDPGEFKLSRTIVNEILTEKSALVIGDSQNDPRFAQQQSIIMAELRSAMAVPLFDEGKVLGILYVDTSNPLHRYNDDYLRLLAMFGNIIAARMLNYELLEERQEKQVLEAELRRAAGIQKKLLNRSRPEVPGYKYQPYHLACRAVGGDLFEIERLTNDKIVFVVADVSGKGMGAALLMSNILASFRVLYHTLEFTLSEAVQLVSQELYNASEPADFATLFVGVLDPKTHELDYINAGHNPPVMKRADGTTEHLEASGFMIGAFPEAMWDKKQISMNQGDLLFIFSDGVTEAENSESKLYGDRLETKLGECSGLGATEVIKQVREDIERYVGDAPRSDDITMLALKRVE